MSLQTAERTELEHFEAFCSELLTEDKKPFVLYEEQRQIMADYFDGARVLSCIVPKKNGKTTLMAALALYHLLTTDNAECIMVAAARHQAEIILRQCRMFVRGSEALKRVVAIRQRTIISLLDEGRIYVLASDEDTADGVIPTLVIVDELHRHKTTEVYRVLKDGLQPRNGQLITISTAGTMMASPLGELRDQAHKTPGFVRNGKYNYVREGNFAFHEWCLDPDDDIYDMAVVKLANPAPWHTEESLQERHDDKLMSPWQWMRFACGIWTEGEEGWLQPPQWEVLCQPPENLVDGETIYVAVRVGAGAGIAIAAPRAGGRVVVAGKVIAAPQQGRIPLEEVEWAIRRLAERYSVRAVLFDPGQFRRSAEILQDAGLPMAEAPHSGPRLVVATATLYRLITAGLLAHDGDKELRAQVLGGQTKETEQGWRLVPNERTPVLIALAIASHEASALPVDTTYWVM